jgi:hypothetical protein
VSDLDAHGDTLLLLGLGLLGEELVEEVEIGRLGARSSRQDGVKALRDGAEPRLEQAFLDAGSRDLAHRDPPAASA